MVLLFAAGGVTSLWVLPFTVAHHDGGMRQQKGIETNNRALSPPLSTCIQAELGLWANGSG